MMKLTLIISLHVINAKFVAEIEVYLNTHITSSHELEKNLEITKIKLEVFAIVDFDNNVLEARKEIIDNLGKQKEVEEVLKICVDKSETFFDVDNVRWNNVDIFFKTKENTDT